MPKEQTYKLRYGQRWGALMLDIAIEIQCIRWGGRWLKKDGTWAGEGFFFHLKRLQSLLHPTKVWHRWNDYLLEHFISHRIIGVMGPASSGKTREAADFARMMYYCWPECTTVILSSTEKETLEDRVWGEIKRYHKEAKQVYPVPGHLIESRQRLVTDAREDGNDGRDMRNGMVGVPCKRSGHYVGLGAYSGRKNKIVILVCDEGQFMPRSYVDAISNLNKNTTFYCIVLGNPKETTDALGLVCEPAPELGGWDGGIDQGPKTKSWATRFEKGVCVQLVGSDSPNLDGSLGIPLITKAQIDADVKFYGRESIQFTMMDEGRMPRGQGLRRVITRQMCAKFGALDEPIWKDDKRTRIFFMDAAYGAVGGDRCVAGELQFGKGVDKNGDEVELLALIDMLIVPVSVKEPDLPEDQIAKWVKNQCEIRTIPPENVFFDSTGRGSLMSAFGRLWSPWVNGIEFGGKPTERVVSNEIQVTCREYYFNMVSELWYSVRHVIEAGQFRGMQEDAMVEGSQREWGFVSGNKIQVEPKENMKLKMGRSPDCFVAGTLVTTAVGDVPIENIKIGDQIITPFGSSAVVMVHENGCSQLTEVVFSDGSTLVGKGKHKVFTHNRGWVRLNELSLTDEIESNYNLPLWQLADACFTRTTNIGFKALVDTIHATEGRVERRDFYTESSGRNTMGLFLQVGACITKMAIGRTTEYLTWTSCLAANIIRCTCAIVQSFLNAWWMRLPQLADNTQLNGTDHEREWNGTRSTPNRYGKDEQQRQSRVRCVEKRSSHSFQIEPSFALKSVAEKNIACGTRIPKDSALCVARYLWRTVMKRRGTVPVSVRQLQPHESRKVYNLTLLEQNVYYANGILVQNCFDALVAGVEGARRLGFIIKRMTASAKPESNQWRRDLRDRAKKVNERANLNYSA